MTPLQTSVDVIIERIPLVNRWASERWQPAAVEIATRLDPGSDMRNQVPGRCVVEPLDAAGNLWRCKGFEIELHPTEAEGYFLNITSPDPRVFVMWRFFEDVAEPRARPVLAVDCQLQRGGEVHGRRRAGRRRTDGARHQRMDSGVRGRSLQTRASTQGAPQRSPCSRNGRRRRPSASIATIADGKRQFTARPAFRFVVGRRESTSLRAQVVRPRRDGTRRRTRFCPSRRSRETSRAGRPI